MKEIYPESRSLIAYHLWKEYKRKSVVCGVNFTLRPGEIMGMLGPNGAGKTTTVGMLYGAVIPTRGFVKLGEYEIRDRGREARYYMGIVTQEDNLDPDFSVFENLVDFAHHYRITGKGARLRARELLARVGLQDYSKNRVDELSGGMKRRLVLARALINKPQIVFLDEPTTGLDPHARQDFWKLVMQLKQDGAGVLLTTHYMDEAQRLCDRLLLMQRGKVIDEGSPEALIDRTVGREVAEVEGLSEQLLQQLASQYQTWYSPFGNAYLLGLPLGSDREVWEQLTAAESLKRRRANLEDVFLRLTGESLEA